MQINFIKNVQELFILNCKMQSNYHPTHLQNLCGEIRDLNMTETIDRGEE